MNNFFQKAQPANNFFEQARGAAHGMKAIVAEWLAQGATPLGDGPLSDCFEMPAPPPLVTDSEVKMLLETYRQRIQNLEAHVATLKRHKEKFKAKYEARKKQLDYQNELILTLREQSDSFAQGK